MSTEFWNRLTSEQKQRAWIIYEKWKIIAESTDRIDKKLATDAVKSVYHATSFSQPSEILFCDSPYDARKKVQEVIKLYEEQGRNINHIFRYFKIELIIRPSNSIRHQLYKLPYINDKQNNQKHPSYTLSVAQIKLLFKVSIQFWSHYAWWFEFCYSVLKCNYSLEKWQSLQLLVQNCGYIIPYENICFICERPVQLLFKQDMILHSLTKPAVVFRDGYQIFAINGVEVETP